MKKMPLMNVCCKEKEDWEKCRTGENTPNLETYLASLTPVTGMIASLLPFSILMRPMFSFRAKRRNASGTTHVLSLAANS
jgi:hypothetical protein